MVVDTYTLSVIILTKNEEVNLPVCLKSIDRLHCKVLIVDSGSEDSTVQIAKDAGLEVIEHHFDNYSSQRNWAQQKLPKGSQWVLHLDADERLTPKLVDEINQIIANPPGDIDGFMLRKRTHFMGRWIKHGGHYPSYHLRLFRRDKGFCEDRLYDQHFIVNGKTDRLKNDYIDVVMSNLHEWTVRHARWAILEALESNPGKVSANRVHANFWGNPIERRRWLREGLYLKAPLFLRAMLYWGYRYFLRLGFLDGKEGLIFHFLQGFWSRFLIDSTIYESRKQQRKSETKPHNVHQ